MHKVLCESERSKKCGEHKAKREHCEKRAEGGGSKGRKRRSDGASIGSDPAAQQKRAFPVVTPHRRQRRELRSEL